MRRQQASALAPVMNVISDVASTVCPALALGRIPQHLTFGRGVVHFSAQPELFFSLKSTETTQRVPQKCSR